MSITPPNLKPGPKSPRSQLVIMAVLLLLVVGVYSWLRMGDQPTDTAMPIETGSSPIDAENAPPAAHVDPELLAEVKDASEADRVVREPQPFLHVLLEAGKLVPGDFRRLGAQIVDDELYRRILDDPAPWRGKALVAKARFNFATEEKVPLGERDSTGVEREFRYWRGVATDDLGRAWSFSLLEEPLDLQPGDVIKIEGFFFKKLALFDPDDPNQLIDPTLHLIGKRVVKSFLRMPPVKEVSRALLATVRDYSIEDRLTLPEEPMWHLLSYVQNSDADALAQAAELEEVDGGQASYITNQALLQHPDEYRGEPVRLLGSVSDQQRPWWHDDENPLDLPMIWHSLLVHNGPSFTYLISIDKPPEWVSGSATVLVEGVFFKLYTYQAINRQTVTCPVVIVKRFVPFRIGTDELKGNLSSILIAVSAPMIFGLLWLAMRDRKAAAALQEQQIARRRARRAATAAGTAPSSADRDQHPPAVEGGTR